MHIVCMSYEDHAKHRLRCLECQAVSSRGSKGGNHARINMHNARAVCCCCRMQAGGSLHAGSAHTRDLLKVRMCDVMGMHDAEGTSFSCWSMQLPTCM